MLHTGQHFLQIPGPTNVPDRILRAISAPVIDHRSQEFAELSREIFARLPEVFQTSGPVIIYPASGTGAWEASIVNSLSTGDGVLMFETGHFSELWRRLAERFGLAVTYVPGDWRRGASAEKAEEILERDTSHRIKAVCVVHNETSTGVTTSIAQIRKAMDEAAHPALLIVDTISSLGSADYRHDEWGVDVTVAGSQKGLMLPPGLSFNAVSKKALAASKHAQLPRSFWDWQDMLSANEKGFFPYTPATNLLYGLREALRMLAEEGLSNVFRRHARHAHATRLAVKSWGLEIACANPEEYSNSVTAVVMPQGYDADALRKIVLERFDMSLGAGLSALAGKVFRIGHLGSFNDLMLAGTLGGIEMGLRLAGVPYHSGGITAALQFLSESCAS
jgi:alanine-glyoxylate transaminase/serine-glyoxylate transaminase/serine-pyruvate transaminase